MLLLVVCTAAVPVQVQSGWWIMCSGCSSAILHLRHLLGVHGSYPSLPALVGQGMICRMACKHHGCVFAERKLCASAVDVVRVPLWNGCAGA
jgi:hypothetical protein